MYTGFNDEILLARNIIVFVNYTYLQIWIAYNLQPFFVCAHKHNLNVVTKYTEV